MSYNQFNNVIVLLNIQIDEGSEFKNNLREGIWLGGRLRHFSAKEKKMEAFLEKAYVFATLYEICK